jgi:hypothetical protein
VAALSFSLSQWGLLFKPGELFFLSPARVWELLIGALVAFYLLRGVASTHRLDGIGSWSRQALSFSGLALIAYSVFSFDKNTPAPGTYTLIPALGTALIILWATPETFVGKLLSWRPLVGLGLISYSAYLWHQPLMAFFRLRSLTEPTEVMLLALVGGCLIFAYCTWRFIERPFRDREKISREHVVIFATSISGLLIALGLFGLINYGFYSRTLPDGSSYAALDRRLRINNGLGVACEEKFTLSPVCRTAAQPEILLWGDSYAMHLLPAILASQPNARVIQMTKNVCGPIYQLAPVPSGKYDLKWAAGCINFNNSVFDWIEQSNSIKYAVLSSPFSQYLSDESRYLSSDGIGVADPKVVLQYFLYTLELLKSRGIKPVVVSPPPQDGRDIGRCLARSKLFATNAAACNISAEKYKRVQAAVNNFLLEVSENFQVIWLADAVCEADVCKAMIDNSFIYRDKGHLSVEGSALLGKRLNFYARISQ